MFPISSTGAQTRLTGRQPVLAAYSRIADRYDRMHGLWLRHAGGEAQSAFEGALAGLLRPGMRLLDAGCGTGALARSLPAICPGLRMTLMDACRTMLDKASDVPARRMEGSFMEIPFPDGEFDCVTCAWALETTPRPARAIAELMRVLKSGGRLVVVFCADVPDAGLVARILCRTMRLRGTGRLLDPEMVAQAARRSGGVDIRRLRCTGPAAAFAIRKEGMS
jgi:ubiquinone/menaquinone biosynthesis C-methylase UbiE